MLIVVILTIGCTLASFFGYVMQRCRLPAILGYLLAGYIVGPYSPGFVADAAISEQLAEIGVILMLFGVGLHFKIEDLLRVKNIAIPGAIGQTFVSALLGALIVYAVGWTVEAGLIIGLSIGVASTVVLVRLLTDNNILHTPKGHIAVGWLIVEDIFTVIILILLPTIASISQGSSPSVLHITGSVLLAFAKFCILALFMFTWGHKIVDYILTEVARLHSQELFTLTIVALVFLIATSASVVFGASIALGAFIAGMVIGKTHVRYQAAANALPLKDIFAVVFFLSVGMLFNPLAIVANFSLFLGLLAVILIAKPLIAYLMTSFLGYSLNTALTVAISLSQIGEFSFILAEEAMNLKLLPEDGFDILVACAFFSIALNPILFRAIAFLEPFLQNLPWQMVFRKNMPGTAKEKQKTFPKAIIVGYGVIGHEIVKILKSFELSPVIIEHNIDIVTNQKAHENIIFGDATEANILKAAHIDEASHLFITLPNLNKVVSIVNAARNVNAKIHIIARLQQASEKHVFDQLGIKYVCSETETLKGFTKLIYQLFRPFKN